MTYRQSGTANLFIYIIEFTKILHYNDTRGNLRVFPVNGFSGGKNEICI